MSLGGDFALPGLSLKLAEAWQGHSVTGSSAQHAGEEGLPFPTPLQRWRPVPCKMSPSFSMTVPGSVQAQEEVTPSSSPLDPPVSQSAPLMTVVLAGALQPCSYANRPLTPPEFP